MSSHLSTLYQQHPLRPYAPYIPKEVDVYQGGAREQLFPSCRERVPHLFSPACQNLVNHSQATRLLSCNRKGSTVLNPGYRALARTIKHLAAVRGRQLSAGAGVSGAPGPWFKSNLVLSSTTPDFYILGTCRAWSFFGAQQGEPPYLADHTTHLPTPNIETIHQPPTHRNQDTPATTTQQTFTDTGRSLL